MTDKNINLRLNKRFFLNLLSLTLWFVALWITLILIEVSDTAILEHKSKYRLTYTPHANPTNEFSLDEQRIANRFVTDTLPGLMQKGLIKKYERHESGTSLLVAGNLWKKRTPFFKQCLLTEVFIYNKVNGYESWTRIIDSESGKLFAQISPSTKIEFYD